jgi:uncharacterized protein YaeQ
MAMKATVFKATVQVSDMDRAYYNDLKLTIAQHPSETDERTMVRLLAFSLHASEGLKFTEGISAEDEPDIWSKSLSGEIEIWIDVGLPDEKRIRKACNRAKLVYIYAYGGRAVEKWWEPMAQNLARHQNLKVIVLPQTATRSLGKLAQRTMALQCTVQDGQIWIGDSNSNVSVEPEPLYGTI